MESRSRSIVINDAASQYDRWLRALDPNYARPDARTFSELLNFAVEYGSLINFYNLQDNPDGDWVRFFLSDPTMALASIDATDFSAIESEFTRVKQLARDATSFDRKFGFLHETFQTIFNLGQRIDEWLRGLDLRNDSDITRLLRDEIIEAIEAVLGPALRELKSYDEGAGMSGALGRPIGLDYSGFLPLWNLDDAFPDPTIYRGRRPVRRIDRAVRHLAPIFHNFLDAISGLKLFARTNLAATLDTGNHKPDIALYIAFCMLFKTAQETINTFSERYTNFYYRSILREGNHGPIPDSVYLTFALADSEDVLSTTVPRDTLFPAGQDLDGRDILYGWDKDLVVTAAQIAELRTLRVIGGPLFIEDDHQESFEGDSPAPSRVIREILSSEILIEQENGEALGETTPSLQTSWATFGQSRVGKTSSEITKYATLGFALASTYLLLTGGARTVGISIRYSIEFTTRVLDPLLDELARATGLDPDDIFRDTLNNAFDLFVSTAGGWLHIESYAVTLLAGSEDEDPGFELWFKLPSNAPPVTAFDPENEEGADKSVAVSTDPEINATNPAPSLPTLKAYLKQLPVDLAGPVAAVSVYPISLLEGIQVTAFNIHTEVTNLTTLVVENTDGEVDTSVPFLVFGGLPVAGSYLQIRHSELFVKTIDLFQMNIAWFNLPQNYDGFKGYYKYYVIGPNGETNPDLFNNAVFRGRIIVQNPGSWGLQSVSSELSKPDDVYLFRTENDCAQPLPFKDGKLCSRTEFDTLKVLPLEPPAYYNPADTSIRLQLNDPSYGFGYDLYASNVLNAVIEDLPQPDACRQKCLDEWHPIAAAKQCVENCLTVCKENKSAEDYKLCIETCLAACGETLAATAVERIIACIIKCAVPEALKLLEPRLNACLKAASTERSRCIKQTLKISSGSLSRKIGKCLEECWSKWFKLIDAITVIEEAILCVAACTIGAGEPDDTNQECIEACLISCVNQLDEMFAAALKVCMDECMSLKKELRYPNEPYLPQAASLSANYAAHCAVATTKNEQSCGQLFHLLPFGGYERINTAEKDAPTLLPVFDYPGNLYIGFSRLIPPQTLTLLFQMAAENEERAASLPTVYWDYLASNRWTQLQTFQIKSDSTNGLANTGIVTLTLPPYDPSGNTVLSGDHQWIRVATPRKPAKFPETAAIFPNSGIAIWQNIDNTGEHLRKPLPAYTINSSVQDLPEIDSIEQPMESFGGRPPENEKDFEIRVGERLQHKDRGILAWDYERLVLERFPTISKVQTLPARNPQRGNAPGDVLVVVVTGPDSTQVIDPTTPRASSEMLAQIQTYLSDRISTFIRLQVVNPIYVRIKVTAAVAFKTGEDMGACLDRLNNELVEYLSPWFYDPARSTTQGEYASEADISEFIQTQPYVEALYSIMLTYEPDSAKLEWYFLTSALQHEISLWESNSEEKE